MHREAARDLAPRSAPRAFSLIELLVVITIIAVVIGITVPALGYARDLARKSSTEATINSLVQAVSQFQAAEDRDPGYFSVDEMGQEDNEDRGFTGMQNIMLDLMGGTTVDSSATLANVGPYSSATDNVAVDLNLINAGEGSRGYFTPDPKTYVVVEGGVVDSDNDQLPDVVDAWGVPILAWQANDLAPVMQDGMTYEEFARHHSDDDPARYYWASNARYLRAQDLTDRQLDQNSESLLGGSVSETDAAKHLSAMLGSPNTAVNPDANSNILPRAGRGTVVFQSAGSDRIYLSQDDGGFGKVGGDFAYTRNWKPASGTYDSAPIDIVDGFNDIVVGAGN